MGNPMDSVGFITYSLSGVSRLVTVRSSSIERNQSRSCRPKRTAAAVSMNKDQDAKRNASKKVNNRYVSFNDALALAKQKEAELKLEMERLEQQKKDQQEMEERFLSKKHKEQEKEEEKLEDMVQQYSEFRQFLSKRGLDAGTFNTTARRAVDALESKPNPPLSRPSSPASSPVSSPTSSVPSEAPEETNEAIEAQRQKDEQELDEALFFQRKRRVPALNRPPPRPAAPAAPANPPPAVASKPIGLPIPLVAKPAYSSKDSGYGFQCTYTEKDSVNLETLSSLQFVDGRYASVSGLFNAATGIAVFFGSPQGQSTTGWVDMLRECESKLYRPSSWDMYGVCKEPCTLKSDVVKKLKVSILVDSQDAGFPWLKSFGQATTFVLCSDPGFQQVRVYKIFEDNSSSGGHAEQVLQVLNELLELREGDEKRAPVKLGVKTTAKKELAPASSGPEAVAEDMALVGQESPATLLGAPIRQNADKGRVVINHSTMIPGLVRVLDQIALEPGVNTIVPGRITSSSRSIQNHSGFYFRVTTQTQAGWKLLARKGPQVQEVFIVGALSKEDLIKIAMKWSTPRKREYDSGAYPRKDKFRSRDGTQPEQKGEPNQELSEKVTEEMD